MASLQKKGENWYCQFIYGGKRHTCTIGRVSEVEATRCKANAENLLHLLKTGRLEIPRGCSVVKKELDTFRVAWNFGLRRGLTDMQFPSRGIIYPKTEEKLPFILPATAFPRSGIDAPAQLNILQPVECKKAALYFPHCCFE